MNINEENEYYLGLTKSVHETIDKVYENIFACEDSMESLLKIAPSIFSYSEFLMLLEDYKKLEEKASKFEGAVVKIRETIGANDIGAVISLDLAINALGAVFMLLNDYMEQANTRIEAKQFDMDKVMLLERIDNKIRLDYDVADYLELNEAMKHIFIVVRVKDMYDDDFDEAYGVLNVLSIKGFNTRAEANRYALMNGISRDFVITRL